MTIDTAIARGHLRSSVRACERIPTQTVLPVLLYSVLLYTVLLYSVLLYTVLLFSCAPALGIAMQEGFRAMWEVPCGKGIGLLMGL